MAILALPAQAAAALPSPGGGEYEMLLAGGRKVIVGQAPLGNGTALAVWQRNPDGSPDPTFNGDGFAILPVWGASESALSVAGQADGKLVVAGVAVDPACSPLCPPRTVVVRLNPDGTLDPSFNRTGMIAVSFVIQEREVGFDRALISVLRDGSIAVSWDRENGDGPYLILAADGALVPNHPLLDYTTLVPRDSMLPRPQGLWQVGRWGEGVYLAQQGEEIAAIWFSYAEDGTARWSPSTLQRVAPGSYLGTSFTAVRRTGTGDGARTLYSATGVASLRFTDHDLATFRVSDDSGHRYHSLTLGREPFGPPPLCVWGAVKDSRGATNYQDLWSSASAGDDAGLALAVAHEGDTLFAVAFDYDSQGQPRWRSGVARATSAGHFEGVLNETRWLAEIRLTEIGHFALVFDDGNTGTFVFESTARNDTAEVPQRQVPITRRVFVSPGTVCR